MASFEWSERVGTNAVLARYIRLYAEMPVAAGISP
jgi:hypothetical protein